jgi:tRNA(Ile2) C34 agmatinyltransferase TiaS
MLRTSVCLAAMLLVAGALHTASAQTTAPAATPAPSAAPAPAAKPSKLKLTVERLKEMRAKWKANKPKLTACRKEVKSKGLAGDDRWFYIEDCMDKT